MSQTAFENNGSSGGIRALQLSESSCLKRERGIGAGRELEDTERSRAERRAEQLRKNDNAVARSVVV